MTTCFICLNEDLEMKELKCCRKTCHDKCFQSWIDHNKFCKFNNIILCPCCRTNIRNDIYIPLELHNMPMYFYLQYEKEVNHRDVYATEVCIEDSDSDSDDEERVTSDNDYTDDDDNDY